MITFADKRQLPVCGLRQDGSILLTDELNEALAQGAIVPASLRLDLPEFDIELEVYKITRQAGGVLPPAGSPGRELLRSLIAVELFHAGQYVA